MGSASQPREVWIWKSPEDFCGWRDDAATVGRIVRWAVNGKVRITVHRHLPIESHGVTHLIALARLDEELVGFASGYLADLSRYEAPYDFVEDMDAIDQTTYDAAAAIAALGLDYWETRDRLLFLDRAEVIPAQQRRGIGRSLVEGLVAFASRKGHELDLLLQPYPDAIKLVSPQDAEGRRRASAADRRKELAKITRIWLRVFPFLSFLSKAGLHKDRRYYFGTVPICGPVPAA